MEATIDQIFSKTMKIQKWNYISGATLDKTLINQQLKSLEQFDLTTLDADDKKKSFWINVYNGLTNYWITEKQIKEKMKEDPRIFIQYKVNIGGYKWSLDNIEHGILRCNAKVKYWPLPQFMRWDKRRRFICKKLDYRIHFALNCGANSCPAIAFYDTSNINNQLNEATKVFEDQEFIVSLAERKIECSKIYSWYRQDFTNRYLNDPNYQDFKVDLKNYDWSIK